MNTEENVMTSTDGQFIPEDESNSKYRSEDSLSRFTALAAPLMDQDFPWIDIEEDIMIPAQQCDCYQRGELNRLSTVFSMMLEKMVMVMLCTLDAYLSTEDLQQVLGQFVDSMQDLSRAAANARENTPVDAFRLGLLEELRHGRF